MKRRIDHAAHYLPAQGPIGVFIHHNTLHAFEGSPFEAAVIEASERFRTEPYASESQYREAFARGRIRDADLDAILRADLGTRADEALVLGRTRLELRRHALLEIEAEESATALAWRCEEGQLFEQVAASVPVATLDAQGERTRRWAASLVERGESATLGLCLCTSSQRAPEQALVDLLGRSPLARLKSASAPARELALRCLFGAVRQRFQDQPEPEPVRHVRLRDAVLARTGQDADAFVHPTLIHLVSAFLDQGIAYWRMPYLERGLFVAARALLAQPISPPNEWMRRVTREMQRLARLDTTAGQVLLEALDELGLDEDEQGRFIESTLLALPGWAGMVHQLEVRPDRAPTHAPPASLLDFLALRLVLERVALAFIAELRGLPSGNLGELRALLGAPEPVRAGETLAQAAYTVLLHAGLAAPDVLALDDADVERLTRELEAFGALERRRIWHLAYERRHAFQVLDPLLARGLPEAPEAPPRFQAIFCLDERSESIRRHLEEVLPEVETWGTAGFFGVAMYYKGVDDAVPIPLCPIAITPKHEVHEHARPGTTRRLTRRRAQRRIAGRLAANAEIGSRTLFRGTIWSAALGMLSAVPLVLRVAFPRATARFGKGLGELSLPHVDTVLDIERTGDEKSQRGSWLGFSVEEMADIVAGTLGDMGLTRFAPVVLVVGHGSSSLNNPHESAHDCGACGGGRGGAQRAGVRADGQPRPGPRAALGAGHSHPPGYGFRRRASRHLQ